MGGTGKEDSAENLMNLCGSGTQGCHGWIEGHREEAMEQGWLVRRGMEPEEVPVAYRGQWCWLTSGGLVIPASEGERRALGAPRRL